MDIETQLQFINTEIAECESRKSKLEAIKLSLMDASSIKISSIDSLNSEIIRLTLENDNLKVEPINIQAEVIQ